MRINTAMKRIAVPYMQELGFTHVESDSYGHCFKNTNGTRSILFDSNIMEPGFLRASYYYINSYYGSYSGIPLDQMSNEMRMGIDLFPSSPNKIEETVRILMEITKEKVLPYIDYIADNEVFFTNEMYNMLSENTIEKAVSCAKSNNLDFSPSPRNALGVENSLLDMRGDDRYERKNRYDNHKNEIIGLVAYWGEVLRHKNGGPGSSTWQWEKEDDYIEVRRLYNMGSYKSIPTFNLEAHRPVFEIQFEQFNYNPANTLIAFWNCYPEQFRNPNSRLTFI